MNGIKKTQFKKKTRDLYEKKQRYSVIVERNEKSSCNKRSGRRESEKAQKRGKKTIENDCVKLG